MNIEFFLMNKEELDWISDLVGRRKIAADILPVLSDVIRVGNRLLFGPQIFADYNMRIDYWKKMEDSPDRSSSIMVPIERDGIKLNMRRESLDYGRLLYDYGDMNSLMSVDLKDMEKLFKLAFETPKKAPEEVNRWYKTVVLRRSEEIGQEGLKDFLSDLDELGKGEEKTPFIPYEPNIVTYEEICRAVSSGGDLSEIDFEGYNNISSDGEPRVLDMSSAKILKADRLLMANNITGVILPEGLDFSGIDFRKYPCEFDEIDLSKARNVNLVSFLEADYCRNAIMPEYLDLSGIEDFKTRRLWGYDFSKTKNFPSEIIDWYSSEGVCIFGTIFPENFDTGQIDFSKVRAIYSEESNLAIPQEELDKTHNNRMSKLIEKIMEVCAKDGNAIVLHSNVLKLAETAITENVDEEKLLAECKGKGAGELHSMLVDLILKLSPEKSHTNIDR